MPKLVLKRKKAVSDSQARLLKDLQKHSKFKESLARAMAKRVNTQKKGSPEFKRALKLKKRLMGD